MQCILRYNTPTVRRILELSNISLKPSCYNPENFWLHYDGFNVEGEGYNKDMYIKDYIEYLECGFEDLDIVDCKYDVNKFINLIQSRK